MSFFQHLIGALSALTIRDEYNRPDHYVPPEIVEERRDRCGRVVSQIVKADTHEQATRHLQGFTIQGDRSVVATKIGRGKWNVHVEDWDTSKKGRGGMIQSDGYDTDGWSESREQWKKRTGRR
jgi:hypothetical protein